MPRWIRYVCPRSIGPCIPAPSSSWWACAYCSNDKAQGGAFGETVAQRSGACVRPFNCSLECLPHCTSDAADMCSHHRHASAVVAATNAACRIDRIDTANHLVCIQKSFTTRLEPIPAVHRSMLSGIGDAGQSFNTGCSARVLHGRRRPLASSNPFPARYHHKGERISRHVASSSSRCR